MKKILANIINNCLKQTTSVDTKIKEIEVKDIFVEQIEYKYKHVVVKFKDGLEFSIVLPKRLLKKKTTDMEVLKSLIYLEMYRSKDQTNEKPIGPIRIKILE